MGGKIAKNPAQAFLQGRELGRVEGRQVGFDAAGYIQFLRLYNVNADMKIFGADRFKKFYIAFQQEKARLFNEEFFEDLDKITTAVYHATETAQEMGIDLNFDRMAVRAMNFNDRQGERK